MSDREMCGRLEKIRWIYPPVKNSMGKELGLNLAGAFGAFSAATPWPSVRFRSIKVWLFTIVRSRVDPLAHGVRSSWKRTACVVGAVNMSTSTLEPCELANVLRRRSRLDSAR